LVDPERYQKKLEANRIAAQSTRDRKKSLRDTLTNQVASLQQTKQNIDSQIVQLEAENAVLKNEFVHLQNIVNGSMTLTKLVAKEEMLRLSSIPQGLYDHKDTQSMASLYLIFMLWTFKDQLNVQQTHLAQEQQQLPRSVEVV